MEMIDIKNKKLRDDEFYKIRKEVLATWETNRLPQIPART